MKRKLFMYDMLNQTGQSTKMCAVKKSELKKSTLKACEKACSK